MSDLSKMTQARSTGRWFHDVPQADYAAPVKVPEVFTRRRVLNAQRTNHVPIPSYPTPEGQATVAVPVAEPLTTFEITPSVKKRGRPPKVRA